MIDKLGKIESDIKILLEERGILQDKISDLQTEIKELEDAHDRIEAESETHFEAERGN